MSRRKQISILFVCMGNICRSPAAHGVMDHLVGQRNLADHITVDSAGTLDYHEGSLPDARMRSAASRRGYSLTHRSRPLVAADFQEFDYIFAMDDHNIATMRRRFGSPPDNVDVQLFLDILRDPAWREVPDPYSGGPEGFELVMDLVEQGCAAILDHIQRTHRIP